MYKRQNGMCILYCTGLCRRDGGRERGEHVGDLPHRELFGPVPFHAENKTVTTFRHSSVPQYFRKHIKQMNNDVA